MIIERCKYMRKKQTQGVERRDVNASKRVIIALDLFALGLTYDEIAARAGYRSRGACYDAIQRELQRCIYDKVDEARKLQCFQLDRLHQSLWPHAVGGIDEDGNTIPIDDAAVKHVLDIMERRAKLLGLDAKQNEQSTATNYKKTIVLTHITQKTEVSDGSND